MWYEIKIKTQSNALEAIYPLLFKHGLSGIVTEDPNDPIFSQNYQGDWDYFEPEARKFEYDGALIKAYIEIEDCESLIHQLSAEIMALKEYGFQPEPALVSSAVVKEEDWANEWKKYYHTFEIAEGIIIKPAWEEYQAKPDQLIISLDSGKAFGTGTHETTTLCAQMIKKYAGAKDSFYDIGCGSGILAIIAKKLGFKTVKGLDIDEVAVDASKENMLLNFADDKAIDFQIGVADDLSLKADMIVSNIIADVIITIAPKVRTLLKENAYYIASGILDTRLEEVKTALVEHKFDIVEIVTKGEWCAIVCR